MKEFTSKNRPFFRTSANYKEIRQQVNVDDSISEAEQKILENYFLKIVKDGHVWPYLNELLVDINLSEKAILGFTKKQGFFDYRLMSRYFLCLMRLNRLAPVEVVKFLTDEDSIYKNLESHFENLEDRSVRMPFIDALSAELLIDKDTIEQFAQSKGYASYEAMRLFSITSANLLILCPPLPKGEKSPSPELVKVFVNYCDQKFLNGDPLPSASVIMQELDITEGQFKSCVYSQKFYDFFALRLNHLSKLYKHQLLRASVSGKDSTQIESSFEKINKHLNNLQSSNESLATSKLESERLQLNATFLTIFARTRGFFSFWDMQQYFTIWSKNAQLARLKKGVAQKNKETRVAAQNLNSISSASKKILEEHFARCKAMNERLPSQRTLGKTVSASVSDIEQYVQQLGYASYAVFRKDFNLKISQEKREAPVDSFGVWGERILTDDFHKLRSERGKKDKNLVLKKDKAATNKMKAQFFPDSDDDATSQEEATAKANQVNVSHLVNTQDNGEIKFDWATIYAESKDGLPNDKGVSYAQNRTLQNLLNKTLDVNSRVLYYSSIPAIRGLDYKDLAYFSKGSVYDFVLGQTAFWELSKPKTDVGAITQDFLPAEFEPFTTKTDWEQFQQGCISREEFVDKLIKTIDKKFKSVRHLVRQSEEHQKRTGNWLLHIGWPFVHGHLEDERAVRTPLMWFSVKMTETADGYLIERNDETWRINTSLIIESYSSERKFPTALETTFKSIDEVFREYARHGIRFSESLTSLRGMPTLTKIEFESKRVAPLTDLVLINYLCLENRDPSGDIFNDLTRIVRDFKDISLPNPNRDAFNELEDENVPALPYDVDLAKAQAVELALEDSTVIWGPPGTGKSEAITTILAHTIASGKNALLVAEKDAALAVVLKRLDNKFGLAPFVLKLNGDGASKGDALTNKEMFYGNLLRLINALEAPHGDVGERKFTNLVNELEDKYALMLQRLHAVNITAADFWAMVHRMEALAKQIPQIRLFSFLSNFDEVLAKTTKLVELEKTQRANEEKLARAKEAITEQEELLAQALYQFTNALTPPLAYLPQESKTVTWVLQFSDARELFRAMNPRRYNLFNEGKAFREHQAGVLAVMDKAKLVQGLQNSPIWEKNQALVQHYEKEQVKTQAAIDALVREQVDAANQPLLLEFKQELEEWTRPRLSVVVEVLQTWDKILGESYSYHEAIEQAKSGMSDLYQWQSNKNRTAAINLIRGRIQADPQLLRSYRGLSIYAKNAKGRPRPAEIFKSNFALFQALFPIMIATPSEVSKYMPNDPNIFDYGIFDEASQVYFHVALPTIHRCQSLIIAGDDKQLSPDNFFATQFEADEEVVDLAEAEKDADSLLIWGKAMFREKMLTNHYRSSHFKLIEYSNIRYYGGHLLALSSPDAINKPILVKHLNGHWEDKTNLVEATEAINLALTYLAQGHTVGIVTFNYEQKELISDLIDSNPEANRAFANSSGSFVRNIVNVQGDEADIIIFSLAYAPLDGKLRVGGLNHITPNVLNVAITRSRKQMVVLQSFELSDLGRGGEHTDAVNYIVG